MKLLKELFFFYFYYDRMGFYFVCLEEVMIVDFIIGGFILLEGSLVKILVLIFCNVIY